MGQTVIDEELTSLWNKHCKVLLQKRQMDTKDCISFKK